MGLENGFILRSKKFPEYSVDYIWFCNYHELDDWMAYDIGRKSDSTTIITSNMLDRLRNYIEPLAKSLFKIYDRISYYDEHGYPKFIQEVHYSNDFNPHTSGSSFAGDKLIRLYLAVCGMLNLLEENSKEDIYFEFYSSY